MASHWLCEGTDAPAERVQRNGACGGSIEEDVLAIDLEDGMQTEQLACK
jgi:hypothetical protein